MSKERKSSERCYGPAFVRADVAAMAPEIMRARDAGVTQIVETTPGRCCWIKLSVSDDGPTPTETKAFRAAGNAGLDTKSTIGSHTVRGTVAKRCAPETLARQLKLP
jgi:predicted metal-dependent phosphotriesterase family hydrolase